MSAIRASARPGCGQPVLAQPIEQAKRITARSSRRRERQAQREARAAVARDADADTAAVRLGDGSYGREPHACAAHPVGALGEGVEEARQQLAVDARPVVLDAEHELAVRLEDELDAYFAARVAEGVVEQVVERLAQALRIHRDGPRPPARAGARASARARTRRRHGIVHDRADVDRGALDVECQGVGAAELEQVVDHQGEARRPRPRSSAACAARGRERSPRRSTDA